MRAAVILNAEDYKSDADRLQSAKREFDDLASLGFEPTEIDLRSFFGQAERLEAVLVDFGLLWVRGGNPFILRRAFAASGADVIISDLLARDALAYGGYSAGAAMLTPSLRGIELVDDPHEVPHGYSAEVIVDCLGIVPHPLVPHFRSDHPESERIEKVVQLLLAEHIPFIALRDGEVWIRDGDREFVVS